MNVLDQLKARFGSALPEGAGRRSRRPCARLETDPKFGDYQANGCMALAKSTGKKPRDLAAELAAAVDLSPMAGTPEVAGPGFLNVRLDDAWIAGALRRLLSDDRLGVPPSIRRETS